MKEKHPKWRGAVIDLLLIGGAVLVSVGVGLIYLPAGIVAGGVLSIVGAVLMAKGR